MSLGLVVEGATARMYNVAIVEKPQTCVSSFAGWPLAGFSRKKPDAGRIVVDFLVELAVNRQRRGETHRPNRAPPIASARMNVAGKTGKATRRPGPRESTVCDAPVDTVSATMADESTP